MTAEHAEMDLAVEATGQWGMFTAAQAVRLGLTRQHLSHLTAAGRINRTETRGVYQFAGVPDEITLGALRATWLGLAPHKFAGERLRGLAAGGPEAVISRLAAAHYVYDLGTLGPESFDFTVPATRRANNPGIRFHVQANTELQVVDGLPVTTIPQTVADLYRDGIDNGHLGDIITDALLRAATATSSIAAALDPLTDGTGRDTMLHALSVVGTPASLAEANDFLFAHVDGCCNS